VQPPNAAQSATIPTTRILIVPRPARIQAQPEIERNTVGARAPGGPRLLIIRFPAQSQNATNGCVIVILHLFRYSRPEAVR
jgi:hypothetical protein